MIIRDDNMRWAYISIPKCACTSIKIAIETHFGLAPAEMVHNRSWPSCQPATDAIPADYFVWSVVRHPLDRFVSTWKNKCHSDDPAWPAVVSDVYRPLLRCTFREFVRAIRSIGSLEESDSHLRPQSMWLRKHAVDCLVPLPHLEHEWPILSGRTGLGSLPHVNASNHEPPAEHYNRQDAEAVLGMYQSDLPYWELAIGGYR
jgi:hypothetical protein